MESKSQNISFLKDNTWLNDFDFLTDVTHYLPKLNVKLQGKQRLVNKMIPIFKQNYNFFDLN